ncbi:MAG: phosphatidate cytidylyltransferase [Sphingopyxis sp.]|nr:phosphatidate cytidylyltransferase [Sphingopyxis sp.]
MSAEAVTKRKSDLLPRVVSGVVLVGIAAAELWFGGWAFAVLLAVGGALVLWEWLALVRKMTIGAPLRILLNLLGPMAVVATVAGLWIVREELGFTAALWVLAMVWATDIGAYFAGRAFGGARLAPSISPSKTWSGLFGGVIAALVVGATLGDRAGIEGVPLWIGAPMGVLAQLGDLAQSWMKRKAGVKDSGRIIPGHGGVFDRVDGLLPVAILLGALALMGRLTVAG